MNVGVDRQRVVEDFVRQLRKDLKITIASEPYIVKDLAVYIDDEGKKWYEYKLVHEDREDVFYLSLDPFRGSAELAKTVDIQLPENLNELESSVRYHGKLFFYEDDYEAEVYYPWQGDDIDDAEEIEIYEYSNPVEEEYLTVELYWDEDDELDDWDASLSRPLNLELVKL